MNVATVSTKSDALQIADDLCDYTKCPLTIVNVINCPEGWRVVAYPVDAVDAIKIGIFTATLRGELAILSV